MCQPQIPSPSLPHPLALGNHKSVLSVCECVLYAYSISPCGLASNFRRYTGWATLDSGLSAVVMSLPSLVSLGFQGSPTACMWIPKNLVRRPPHLPTHPPFCSQPATSSLCWGIYPAPLHHCTRCPVITSPSARPQSESSVGSWLLSFVHDSLIFLASNVSFNFLNQEENDGAV